MMMATASERRHFENWGKPEDTWRASIKAQYNGRHTIQVIAGNNSGPINTGITGPVKPLQMKNLGNEEIVADG